MDKLSSWLQIPLAASSASHLAHVLAPSLTVTPSASYLQSAEAAGEVVLVRSVLASVRWWRVCGGGECAAVVASAVVRVAARAAAGRLETGLVRAMDAARAEWWW